MKQVTQTRLEACSHNLGVDLLGASGRQARRSRLVPTMTFERDCSAPTLDAGTSIRDQGILQDESCERTDCCEQRRGLGVLARSDVGRDLLGPDRIHDRRPGNDAAPGVYYQAHHQRTRRLIAPRNRPYTSANRRNQAPRRPIGAARGSLVMSQSRSRRNAVSGRLCNPAEANVR